MPRSRIATMRVPCPKCPFRKDVPIFLRQERRAEIVESLLNGNSFNCHATVRYVSDTEEGEDYLDYADSNPCAGAAKSIMLSGGTTQMMRIEERLGITDLEALENRGAEVWPLSEWQKLAEGSTGINPEWEIQEIETCTQCDPGCLAPAGYLGTSGAVIDGTESADGECVDCNEPLCSNCADKTGRCYSCARYENEVE